MGELMAGLRPNPYTAVVPKIYAYTTPEIRRHDGWTKIGYTEQSDVVKRIQQQTKTADIEFNLEWQGVARFEKEPQDYFKDYEFHNYLQRLQRVERQLGTEWFHIDGEKSRNLFGKFVRRDYGDVQGQKEEAGREEYTLRREQAEAVEMTAAYIAAGKKPREFLWNAKPRFGKTLATYDLVRRIQAKNVLIVTNRPSIANSWYDDFVKFIGWQTKYRFVSETEALSDRNTLSREQFVNLLDDDEKIRMLAFESLQGLKGSCYFGGSYDKLKWIGDIKWDLLVIDEAHEGVDTYKTDIAFDNIERRFTLHLSGTPFKAIANSKFASDQIYNWSYADEQEAKEKWAAGAEAAGQEGSNPYADLPKLNMYTYQMSKMIADEVNRGIDLAEETEEYAFDLKEFFSTKADGSFQHDAEVDKFLERLTKGEKFPFSTPELRNELAHTFWLMDRVAGVKAMAKKLSQHPIFSEYEIVIAAGNGRGEDSEDNENKKSFDKVQEAIATHDKTITLSVGQLTTGVTVKPWTAVLMLSNMKSPAEYMQAAFRAQNPYQYEKDGRLYKKENAYVFDFSPERTLIIFDEFANSLQAATAAGRGTEEERKQNIERLLNFFPVIGEDSEGRMTQLDAAQVLTIPRAIKAEEVVNRGFMSNFLFPDIGNVFAAPSAVTEILQKVEPAKEEGRLSQSRSALSMLDAGDVNVNENGEVEISNEIIINKAGAVFGQKIYGDIVDDSLQDYLSVSETNVPANDSGKDSRKKTDGAPPPEQVLAAEVTKRIVETLKPGIAEAASDYQMKNKDKERLEKKLEQQVAVELKKEAENFTIQTYKFEKEKEEKIAQAVTDDEVQRIEIEHAEKREALKKEFAENIRQKTESLAVETAKTAIREMETKKVEAQKRDIENDIREHLRGFSRTIPSFIMAYGDDGLRLDNFHEYAPQDVFEEVTSITMEEFLFLRDGGEYVDSATGDIRQFDGHIFDEGVFNDAIKTFLDRRYKLRNYFEEGQERDIFDDIPRQKNNQIYTPKWIVRDMVDNLEKENPGIFDDSSKTFADLFMKSGMYITEIVKRLYKSEVIKAEFPDDGDRLKHIFEHQVYGFAPSKIIYAIAMRYIFGFDEMANSISKKNFKQVDTAEYAKEGRMQELLNREFGNYDKDCK